MKFAHWQSLYKKVLDSVVIKKLAVFIKFDQIVNFQKQKYNKHKNETICN